MSVDAGYVKLHRALFEWEWFDDLVVYKLFTGMLLLANWREGKFRGEIISCGSFVSSVRKLGETLKLSKGQVERGLIKLKASHEITTSARHKYTIYTVVNYSVYQQQQDVTQDSKQDANQDTSRDTDRTLTETQAEDNRRSKEDKKGKKKETTMSHSFVSEAVTRWNTLASEQPNLATVKTISKSRNNKLNTRIKEGLTMEQFVKALEEISTSDFLLGLSGDWAVTFDWLITNDSNLVKVVEGNYRNKEQSAVKQPLSKQFETAQERRKREIREQKERILKELGGGHSDKAADDHGEFIDPIRVF